MSSRSLKTRSFFSRIEKSKSNHEISVIALILDSWNNQYHMFRYMGIDCCELRPEDVPDFGGAWRLVQWQDWDPKETNFDVSAEFLDKSFRASASRLEEFLHSNGILVANLGLTILRRDGRMIFDSSVDERLVCHFFSLACHAIERVLEHSTGIVKDESSAEKVDSSVDSDVGGTTPHS